MESLPYDLTAAQSCSFLIHLFVDVNKNLHKKQKKYCILKEPIFAGWAGADTMVGDDKINNTSELNRKLTEAEAIIGRLKDTLRV